jgi:hypothetical protein
MANEGELERRRQRLGERWRTSRNAHECAMVLMAGAAMSSTIGARSPCPLIPWTMVHRLGVQLLTPASGSEQPYSVNVAHRNLGSKGRPDSRALGTDLGLPDIMRS